MILRILQAYHANFYSIPVFCVSLFTLSVGAFILSQNARSAVNATFFLVCLDVGAWLLGAGTLLGIQDAEMGVWLYRHWTFFFVSFISTCVYCFSTVWLKLFKKQRLWVAGAFLISLTFALLGRDPGIGVTSVQPQFWGLHARYGIASALSLIPFFGFFFAAFYNFLRDYLRETDRVRKIQIRLIAVAFLISFTGSVDYISKITPYSVYPFGYISVFIWILMVAFSIVRYKAMDIETAIHKTLMWIVTTAIATLPFAVSVYTLDPVLGRLEPVARSLAWTGLFVAFYFYFVAVQPRLNQLFRRRSANLQNVLEHFSGELVHLKNLRDLLQRMARMLRRTIYAKGVSVYLRDEKTDQFMPAIAKGRRGLKPIAASQSFLAWLEKKDRVVLASFVGGDPEVQAFNEEVHAYFDETEALLVVPFVISGRMIGLLNLGKKENLRRYSAGEIHFLSQLKSPVTIALSNSLQFENITRLYQQMQHQNERLQELDRLKSQFLANTSHELRTPLNGILGLVEAILDGADGLVNDEQTRHLRMILESGAGLKELINNLLELSRLESGQLRLDIKRFNIANVIDAVMALLEGVARKKNVKLLRELPADLSDVYGDPEKIQRVLINLIGNALKFTEKGAVTVRVTDAGGHLQVEVQDTGIGISEKDLKVIFERFRQADGGDTRNYEGTGLGLSIAREIVRLHGGDIQVSSRVGQGSLFAFALPKQTFQQQEARAAAGSTEISAPEALPTPASAAKVPLKESAAVEAVYDLAKDPEFTEAVRGEGELVLVIDDNPVNREVIRTRLGMHNYEVTEAVDGVQGLEKVSEKKPALVILDLMMPRMSGYEFCKRVRTQYSHDDLPIIMLTAKTDMGDKVYGLQIGANDYISKPFQQEELLARVSVLLKIRRMHEELRHWNAELESRVSLRTRELEDTQKQLIQAEKMATIGTFAGGIAHEINNPLTAVLTNAQILKMGTPNPEDIELIDLIEEGARRCQVIIKKLMKYARKEIEASPIREVSLKKVVDNVAAMLGYQLKNDNVELEIDKDEIGLVQGNEGELEQVFTNLILNARDAIHSAKRTQGFIRIQGAVKEGAICVEVIDNGCGIKQAHLTKIFDPFFTTKDVGSGTGLGLAVVHSILEKHGCRVRVESEEGVGATFLIYFPQSSNKHA